MNITQNDLLAAVAATLATPGPAGDGFTSVELASASGKSVRVILAALKQLIGSGSAEVVIVRRQKINGVWANQPGYRIKP